MIDLFLLASIVLNVFQFGVLARMAGERHSLINQIRCLQQQIEQLQRDLERVRGMTFSSGGSSGLLLLLILGAAAIVLALHVTQSR
jgi:hypothetical protein